MTPEQKNTVIRLLRRFKGDATFHNGMAKGADREAAKIAGNLGYILYGHPGNHSLDDYDGVVHNDWDEPQDNLKRNRVIVNNSNIMIATPAGTTEEKRGSGTWAAIRYARKQHVPLYIVWPDGSAGFEVDA